MNDILDIHLDQHSPVPIYQQIADGVRQLIAAERLKSGTRLPTIRQLASALSVNQNTVVRAFHELEQEHVIVSRRGGGTTVALVLDHAAERTLRQKRLSDIISGDILKALSLNYSPEEVEAAFHVHLARWRAGRGMLNEAEERKQGSVHGNTIRFAGSHDLAIDLLAAQLNQDENTTVEVTNVGSLGGLIALQEGRTDLAGIHLLDEETGEYNYPYVKRVLPGRAIVVIHLAYRIQGLMFLRGNPSHIAGMQDLLRSDVVFANRQQGSGTRVLLDMRLKQDGIPTAGIQGYERELDTHLAVGLAITNREAHTGLGIMAAARSCGLDFLPLFRERYDLVMLDETHKSRVMAPLIAVVSGSKFKGLVNEVGGYDTSEMGQTTTL
jgi:molybdate-binding protein/DNA-binding transcriptional regulator YhcF (GntR family)